MNAKISEFWSKIILNLNDQVLLNVEYGPIKNLK